MLRLIFISVLLFIQLNSMAQEAALENTFAVNFSIASWKLNTSLGHRSVREKTIESSKNRLAFLEVNQFVTKKINPRLSLSFGYKYRDLNNATNETEQRLTQQVAWTHQTSHVRLLSRIRIEQRFRDQFTHRYRYRFSLDMPLSGVKLDVKEFYMVASNELVMARSNKTNLENRFSAGIGYVVSKASKFQLDLTHRMEDFNRKTNHVPFIATSIIFNIN